jgi:hypothetical protein
MWLRQWGNHTHGEIILDHGTPWVSESCVPVVMTWSSSVIATCLTSVLSPELTKEKGIDNFFLVFCTSFYTLYIKVVLSFWLWYIFLWYIYLSICIYLIYGWEHASQARRDHARRSRHNHRNTWLWDSRGPMIQNYLAMCVIASLSQPHC